MKLLSSLPQLTLSKYAALALIGVGLLILVRAALVGDVIFTRYYRRYVGHIDRNLKLLSLEGSGQKMVAGQALGALLMAGVAVFMEMPACYALIALIGVLPTVYLSQKRSEYVRKLEQQVDSLILGMANSLKTVPSPAAALAALAPVVPVPTKYEVDRILKEMRVGSTLEQAILNMSARIKSPAMDSALSALLIGLQVGGNLPAVLENSAATIREMGRLEGVVKTKTSEGRAQLWVLALFPFGICLVFNYAQEGYFDPLQKTVVGYMVTSVAIAFWLTSLFVARKVLKVDI